MGADLHRVPGHLVVSSAQLAAEGVGPNTITRRVRAGRLTRREVRLREELRVTSPERTLHDLAGTLPQAELDRAVNEALVLGLTTARGLHTYLARSSRRHGANALRDVRRVEPRVTRSRLERAMLALLRRFETDRARDAHLVALGYRVLRFTWRQLTTEPELVTARLAGALAYRAA